MRKLITKELHRASKNHKKTKDRILIKKKSHSDSFKSLREDYEKFSKSNLKKIDHSK